MNKCFIFIILLGLLLIVANLISANQFTFIINQNSNITTKECGGPIDINDKSVYHPCISINDAFERSKLIKRDNSSNNSIDGFNKNSSLTFYIVKDSNSIGISVYNESKYLAGINYYERIQVIAVNERLEKLNDSNQVVIIGEHAQSHFIYILDDYKVTNDINQTVVVEGLTFKDWNNGYYINVVRSYLGSLNLNNNNYINCSTISGLVGYNYNEFDRYILENININNCNFTGTKLYFYLQAKRVIINNSNYDGHLMEVINGNPELLVVNNCTFKNSVLKKSISLLSSVNVNGNVQISNCKFINNTLSRIYAGGLVNYPSLIQFSISNSILIDNEFLSDNNTKYNSCIFSLGPMNDRWSMTFRDILIARYSDSVNSDASGLIGSTPGRGNININNMSLKGYSFYYVTLVAHNSTIKIDNSPSLNISSIYGNNNTIIYNNILINNTTLSSSGSIISSSSSSISSSNSSNNNNNNDQNNNNNNNQNKIIIIIISVLLFSVITSSIIIISIFKKKIIIDILNSHIINNKKDKKKNNNNKYNNNNNNNNNNIDIQSESDISGCDNVTMNSYHTSNHKLHSTNNNKPSKD